MQKTVIPAVAAELEALSNLDLSILSSLLHAKGVNVRHLGAVRSCISQTRDSTKVFGKKPCTHPCQGVLLQEMVARVIKCELRRKHRDEMRNTGFPAEMPYFKIAVGFLNKLLFEGTILWRLHYQSSGDENTWQDVKKILLEKFPNCLETSEMAVPLSRIVPRSSVLSRRIQTLAGIVTPPQELTFARNQIFKEGPRAIGVASTFGN
jgi:hypothetical protein